MATVGPGPRGPAAPSAALIVLDGWGLAPGGPGNAISLARTPVFDSLWSSHPNAVLREAFTGAERVQLIGLVSDGGVHSGWSHLEALIRLGAELRVPDLVLHAFTDGRDTLPTSGAPQARPDARDQPGPGGAGVF